MIQRIQTLYLLLVVAMGIALLFLPVVEFLDAKEMIVDVTPLDVHVLNGWWGLTLATVLIPMLALVDIFLYKNRILQARLNIFTVMLCLGWYGVLGIMLWFMNMNLTGDWYIRFWCCIPLISLVLTMMATRRILKDEALVRAADRIR